MSKKHFIALADMIREHNTCAVRNNAYTAFTEGQIGALADFCLDINSAFKRGRWLEYIAGHCGPNGGAR